ncbi:hypothetical protein OAO87_00700 [bacterium]|nr:hypothetical protein [bacterium]
MAVPFRCSAFATRDLESSVQNMEYLSKNSPELLGYKELRLFAADTRGLTTDQILNQFAHVFVAFDYYHWPMMFLKLYREVHPAQTGGAEVCALLATTSTTISTMQKNWITSARVVADKLQECAEYDFEKLSSLADLQTGDMRAVDEGRSHSKQPRVVTVINSSRTAKQISAMSTNCDLCLDDNAHKTCATYGGLRRLLTFYFSVMALTANWVPYIETPNVDRLLNDNAHKTCATYGGLRRLLTFYFSVMALTANWVPYIETPNVDRLLNVFIEYTRFLMVPDFHKVTVSKDDIVRFATQLFDEFKLYQSGGVNPFVIPSLPTFSEKDWRGKFGVAGLCKVVPYETFQFASSMPGYVAVSKHVASLANGALVTIPAGGSCGHIVALLLWAIAVGRWINITVAVLNDLAGNCPGMINLFGDLEAHDPKSAVEEDITFRMRNLEHLNECVAEWRKKLDQANWHEVPSNLHCNQEMVAHIFKVPLIANKIKARAGAFEVNFTHVDMGATTTLSWALIHTHTQMDGQGGSSTGAGGHTALLLAN